MPLSPNTRLGRYEVRAPLGAGGMGEVYLARDTELGRTVALKVLPAEFASDQQRMRRFVQEARAASALNHPNILTIYEVGHTPTTHFIATEFVDGETLRQHLAGAQTKLTEALNVTIQTADALSAAHEAGIVHRDIKPENIMLRRRDGYVKVLDFGLAKLLEPAEADTEAPTRPMVNTGPGVVMGTVNYMSPEQARGLAVDARTDVWSLGAVLYEMIAGRAPFEGATPSDVIAKILEREPPAIARFTREAPEALEWIVSKALARDRDERYQTAREMLADLKKLSRRLELDAEIERSAPPESRSASPTATTLINIGPEEAITTSAGTQAAGVEAVRPTSSAEYLITEIKRHKWGAAMLFALLAVALAGIGFGIYRLLGQKQTALSFQTAKFARLTSTGKAVGAAISPDGKWLVHVTDDGGQQSLWLRQVAVPNSNTQIIPPADVQYWGLAFSPDGNYIYYTAREKTAAAGTLYQVPVLGGTARKLTTGVNSSVAFSPDGKQMAYFHWNEDEGGDRLMIANADGTGERQLSVRRGDEYFFWDAFSEASWSPDGKTLASLVGNHAENYMSVVTVSVTSGEIKFFTPQKWDSVRQVAWLRDGSRLLVTAREHGTDTFNIWQLSYPSGEAQKLTHDLNSYPNISLTSDSSLLAAVQTERYSNIWVLPASDAAHATQITQGRNFVEGLSWTPDGKIVYTSNAGGGFDLYSVDSRGGDPKQLTTNSSFDGMPAVSPDGRYVVFASDRAGTMHLWRMDIDGANAKQLTDKTDDEPNLSPDSRWVVYSSCTNGCATWKVSIDGGQPVQVTDKKVGEIASPAISPDGKQIACIYKVPDAPWKFAIFSFEDGQLTKTFDRPTGAGLAKLHWTADGRAIVYAVARGGVSNLWAQPVDGSPPKQLTNFTSDFIFWFDLARDGKQLALSRGTQASDVVLISDFK